MLATGTLALGGVFFASVPTTALADEGDAHTCTGTATAPGVLAGSYSSVEISGFCVVNAGVAVAHGNLTVEKGGVLIAAFAHNDTTGSGSSKLIVHGNLRVEDGGTLLLGCDPQGFPCLDDSQTAPPSLSTPGRVGGNLIADEALGIVMHNASIGGSVIEHGGGGGVTCMPQGAFAGFGSPAFTALEDSRINGNIRVSGVNSCWLGVENNSVGGSVRVTNNQLADPDAVEILSNTIGGNLVCHGNSNVWDSNQMDSNPPGALFPRNPMPDTVHGKRIGQCVLSSPTTPGGMSGPGLF